MDVIITAAKRVPSCSKNLRPFYSRLKTRELWRLRLAHSDALASLAHLATLGLLLIERIEALGEAAVDRSDASSVG